MEHVVPGTVLKPEGDGVVEPAMVMGRVSVVMPFLNEVAFISEAVASVLAQTYPAWELLLVDDGSTDESGEIARRFAASDPARIKYLQHVGGGSRGTARSRNLALKQTRGEFVAFLDADDLWLPFNLERQVAVLLRTPMAGMVQASTLYCHYPHPEQGRADYLQILGTPPGAVVDPPDLLVTLLDDEDTHPAICSLLVRRRLLEQVGGFPEELGGMYEDSGLLAKLYLHTSVVVAGECSAICRMHGDSVCARAEAEGTYRGSSPSVARTAFLRWLAEHLSERSDVSDLLLRALERQLAAHP